MYTGQGGVPMVEKLWKAMEVGEFAYAIQQAVKSFNGITATSPRGDRGAGDRYEL